MMRVARAPLVVGVVALSLALSACMGGGATRCLDGSYCPSGFVCDERNHSCRAEAGCGDGIVDDGEVCDDGNRVSGDGCAADCTTDERCGNGIVDVGEACDDGNTQSHDGCNQCEIERPTWSQAVPRAIVARKLGAMAYDAAHERIVIFGGNQDGSIQTSNDTWVWDGVVARLLATQGQPQARLQHAMVYDAARKRVVLFGGMLDSGQAFAPTNDTWILDGDTWTRAQPLRSPVARSGHAMAYDPVRRRVMLFGGQDASGMMLGDTWEWDGSDWTQLSPAAAPSARSGAAMAYDARRGRLVLFGGRRNAELELGDTWEWDGTTWTEVTPASGPSARVGHAMAYDAAGKVVVLTGGADTSDTWTWNGVTWTPLASTLSPPVGAGKLMAYDAGRDATVLLGEGFAGLWELHAGQWQPIEPPATPPARGFHAMAYHAATGQVVMFGGAAGGWFDGSSTDYEMDGGTWLWNGGNWRQATPPVSPPLRYGFAMVGRGDSVVLFGGYDSPTSAVSLDDTWVWNGTRWTELRGGRPPARAFHAMAYDAARDQVVMYGGTAYDDHTWILTRAGWGDAGRSPLGERRSASMAYDPVRQRVVLYGGERYDSGWVQLDDTWEWDGEQWTLVAEGTPAPRQSQMMVYDGARGHVAMFGGVVDGSLDPAVWEWDGSEWTSQLPDRGLDPRLVSAAAYDALRQRVVLFGGFAPTPGLDDTWLYSFSRPGNTPDSCVHGSDRDNDGAVGCADADCWGWCAPLSPAGTAREPDALGCGDGHCSAVLENCRMCPQDCGACAPVCGDFVCDPGESCAADCPP